MRITDQALQLLKRTASEEGKRREFYKNVFSLFDKDGDGTISTKELGRVMRSIGFKPSEHELKGILKQVDTDGNGTIDFEEFCILMAKQQSLQTDNLNVTFQIFDKDRDGFIDVSDLKELLTKFGEDLTEAEVSEMIAEVDIDGNGKVDYSEFMAMLRPMLIAQSGQNQKPLNLR